MGTNCAPLIADLFLLCYQRDFMASLSYNKEAEIIQAFYSTFIQTSRADLSDQFRKVIVCYKRTG